MAASPTFNSAVTPDDAAVLCFVCTAACTGSRLVATLNLRLTSTLSNARSVLSSVAAGGDGGSAAVTEPPVNMSTTEVRAALAAPLHPFDFTSEFCFVHGGGCKVYGARREPELTLLDVFPRYPRLGPPSCGDYHNSSSEGGEPPVRAGWFMEPEVPRVIVAYSPPKDVVRRDQNGNRLHAKTTGGGKGGATSSSGSFNFVHGIKKRIALCILYVAQGRGDGFLEPERAMAERLLLQRYTSAYGSRPLDDRRWGGGASSSGAAAFHLHDWAGVVTKWNACIPDYLGRTPLQDAALDGNEPAVRFLLAQPFVQVDQRDRQGNTALHIAISAGHGAVASHLLTAGADPLAMNYYARNTPLHVALLRRRAALVGLLCGQLRAHGTEAKSLTTLTNVDGYSPLQLFELFSPSLFDLCFDGSLAGVRALVGHFLFDSAHLTEREEASGRTAAHVAAASGNVEVLRYLLQELQLGADAGSWWLDARQQTPLHLAALGPHLPCVKYLTEAVGTPFLSHQDINGDTPLLAALKARRLTVAEYFVSQCPPGSIAADAQDTHGISALHLACGMGLARVARGLMEQHSANAKLCAAAGGSEGGSRGSGRSTQARIWNHHLQNTTLVAPGTAHKLRLSKAAKKEALQQQRRAKRLASLAQGHSSAASVASSSSHRTSLRGAQAGASSVTAFPAVGRDPAADCAAFPCASSSAISPLRMLLQRACMFGSERRPYTALMCSIIAGLHKGINSLPVLEVLLKDGAEGCLTCKEDGVDLLYMLITKGFYEMAERLYKRRDAVPAVAAVFSDGTLLCRFCTERNAAGVRWCVEHRCGRVDGVTSIAAGKGYNASVTPLVVSACMGDVATVEYLISNGADVNLSPSLSSSLSSSSASAFALLPLSVAVSHFHEDVVRVLVQAGARVSTGGDGVWSALALAASVGLEEVVKGLVGLPSVSPLDIAMTLQATLQLLPAARVGSVARAVQSRMCVCLAQHIDTAVLVNTVQWESSSSSGSGAFLVHPTELVHLAASQGLFTVVEALAERLLVLPTSERVKLIHTAPSPPARMVKAIEPTVVPLTIKAKRLLAGSGNRRGLYTPPKPFERLLLPNWRSARASKLRLWHRLHMRDVFSYAADTRHVMDSSARSRSELMQLLGVELGMRPWTNSDQRAWTAMDYALDSAMRSVGSSSTEIVCFLSAAGVTLRARHGCKMGAGELLPPLVRAAHAAQCTPDTDACVGTMLCSLIRESQGHATCPMPQIRHLIGAYCQLQRRSALLKGEPVAVELDLREAGSWMDAVILCCVESGSKATLQFLLDDMHFPITREATRQGGRYTQPLLAAVYRGDTEIATTLLRAGCSPHAASFPTSAMCAYIRVKKSEEKRITPLCLAAWMGQCDMIALLLTASPLKPHECADDNGRVADSLRALVRVTCRHCISSSIHGSRRDTQTPRHHAFSREKEQQAASTVRLLAESGHPNLSPLILREAAARGLCEVVYAIVECYGAQAVTADLIPEQINSLHYMARNTRLCGLLRSLLTRSETDEFGIETLFFTDFAKAVVSVYGASYIDNSNRGDSAELANSHLRVGRASSGRSKLGDHHRDNASGPAGDVITMSPVDYALAHGCVEGALLLLALGISGTGNVQTVVRNPSSQVTRVRAVLRHHARACCHFTRGEFTHFHSAVTLGYADVIGDFLAEARSFALVQPMELGAAVSGMEGRHVGGGGEKRTGSQGSVGSTSAGALPGTSPSLFALACLHRHGPAWFPLLEEATRLLQLWRQRRTPGVTRLAARDYMVWVFSGVGVTSAIDALCRDPLSAHTCAEVFPLCADSASFAVDGASGAFMAHLLRTRPECFLLSGGTLVLTATTPLACAVAAGSLEWTQYIAFCSGSIAAQRATVTRAQSTRAMAAAAFLHDKKGIAKQRHHRPLHIRHTCAATGPLGQLTPLPLLTQESYGVDVLVLCTAFLAEAQLRHRSCIGDKKGRHCSSNTVGCSSSLPSTLARLSQQQSIFEFLLSLHGALTRQNVSVIALALAAVQRWDLISVLMARAEAELMEKPPLATALHKQQREEGGDAFSSGATSARFFQCVLPEEVPCVLRRIVGPALHIMHIAACCAPREVLLEIVQHCTRSDVEAACDARGNSSLFYALHHPNASAVLDTFAALKVPFNVPCCQKWSRTALMAAATEGRLPLVSTLLSSGSKNVTDRVNQADRRGNTALMLAAAHGHLDVVELLLASGADASLVDRDGMTAVMHAACAGHDRVAAPMAQHFSKKSDFVSSQTSLLHCAAVGGCWRTAECALKLLGDRAEVLTRDVKFGESAVALAYYFGSARVLRSLLAALYKRGDSAAVVSSALDTLDAVSASVTEGCVERRVLDCAANLENFGWLRGVLTINEVLAKEVARQRQGGRRAGIAGADENLRPGERAYAAPCLKPLRSTNSCLLWCAQSGNAVGVRVLADLNIADNCGALVAAARCGDTDIAKLLVTLDMSDPLGRDAKAGLLPFEVAAAAGHTECAAYLLERTPLRVRELLTELESGPQYAHTLFHRLAQVCGGTILVQLVDQLLASANGDAKHKKAPKDGVLYARLLAQLQRPDEVGFTPFEYAIAMGNPTAVVRTADVMQRLGEGSGTHFGAQAMATLPTAAGVTPAAKISQLSRISGHNGSVEERHGRDGNGSTNASAMTMPAATYVSIANALFEVLPNLSPAVRTVLFDFFEVTSVATSVGFAPVTASRQQKGRLRFGDVRLLGIAALKSNELFAPLMVSTFTPDHERDVLRIVLQDFPYRIRYTPDSFRTCTLGQQSQLLQWLGSSLVLSAYEGSTAADIGCRLRSARSPSSPTGIAGDGMSVLAARGLDTVEVRLIRHRFDGAVLVSGTTLEHTLYVSSSGSVVIPDLGTALHITAAATRQAMLTELHALSRQASQTMRQLPHPRLREASVAVEWSPPESSSSSSMISEATVESMFRRVRTGLVKLKDLIEFRLREVLGEVHEEDIAAVTTTAAMATPESGRPASVQFIFRYTADIGLAHFPEYLSTQAGQDESVVLFNASTMMDVAYVFTHTVLRSVAADVALVRVHYVRDEFLQLMRDATAYPTQRDTQHPQEQPPQPPQQSAAMSTLGSDGFVKFKLELEGASLDAIPIPAMQEMLHATVAAVKSLFTRTPAHTAIRYHSTHSFHSSEIISEAAHRRIQAVLVLFTTKRSCLAKLSGGKLMLCFSPSAAPNKAEIASELRQGIVEDEITVCKRLLPDVLSAMNQRISAYLPVPEGADPAATPTLLTVDVPSIESSYGGDRECVLSALRVLVHKYSSLVLQPFIEGIRVGWDTPLGAFVRRYVARVSVVMETGELAGTCRLNASTGELLYYCPLGCVQSGAFWASAWQLLSAQQVASLLVMQLASLDSSVEGLINTEKSFPCWTSIDHVPAWVTAGDVRERKLRIHARNMFNQRLRAGASGATGDQFKFIGSAVDVVGVKEAGDGCYHVRWQAPLKSGVHKLFVLLRGQQLFNSPVFLSVRSACVDLERTLVISKFNTVVAGRPFTLQLRLTDTFGNRLSRKPTDFTVRKAGVDSDVELLSWSLRGPDTVNITATVKEAKESLFVHLHLSTSDGGSASGGGGGNSAVTYSAPLQCVDVRTFEQICVLRRGLTLDSMRAPSSPTLSSAQHQKLFFRKSIREVEKARRMRDTASIGGVKGKVFPPIVKQAEKDSEEKRVGKRHSSSKEKK